MYFDKDVVKIEDLIKQPERYFAHKPKKDDRKKETLKEHTNLGSEESFSEYDLWNCDLSRFWKSKSLFSEGKDGS